MKNILILIALVFANIVPAFAESSSKLEAKAGSAGKKPRVSITRFTDKAAARADLDDDCHNNMWYGWTLGDAFKELLAHELSESGAVELNERDVIRDIYDDEFELVNADKSTMAKRNKFKLSQYAIAGAVSQFELCSKGVAAGGALGSLVGIGGLDLAVNRSTASVGIDLRLIDVETGTVIKTFSTSGTASSTKVGVEADVKGVPFGSTVSMNTPLGEATREAIKKAASEILLALKPMT